MSEIERLLSIRTLKDATDIANQNGWRIPKDRFDLRADEIMNDEKFWECLFKELRNKIIDIKGQF